MKVSAFNTLFILLTLVSCAVSIQVSIVSRYLESCASTDRGALRTEDGWKRETTQRLQTSWRGPMAEPRADFMVSHCGVPQADANGFYATLSRSGQALLITVLGLCSSSLDAQRQNERVKARVNEIVRHI